MVVLVQVPEVPDDTKDDFLDELRRFRRALKRRAVRGEECRTRAKSIPPEQGGQRSYRYRATFTVGPLMAGVIDPQAWASPTGFEQRLTAGSTS